MVEHKSGGMHPHAAIPTLHQSLPLAQCHGVPGTATYHAGRGQISQQYGSEQLLDGGGARSDPRDDYGERDREIDHLDDTEGSRFTPVSSPPSSTVSGTGTDTGTAAATTAANGSAASSSPAGTNAASSERLYTFTGLLVVAYSIVAML